MERFGEILTRFSPITLEEMSGIRLMNRMDTKFVTTQEKLRELLLLAQGEYFAQEVGGERLSEYDTTYFDTPAYDMFHVHQSGHANRQKLRFRTYVGSGLQFLEVKTKNNHGRTKKKRMEVGDMLIDDAAKREFIARHLRYDVDILRPVIQNNFKRITLVNKARTERLTIDLGLSFHNIVSGIDAGVGNLVVIELKRDGLCPSPVLSMLRTLRIHPHGFSKYCMGTAMTNPEVRVNRFKRKLIEVEKTVGHRLRIAEPQMELISL